MASPESGVARLASHSAQVKRLLNGFPVDGCQGSRLFHQQARVGPARSTGESEAATDPVRNRVALPTCPVGKGRGNACCRLLRVHGWATREKYAIVVTEGGSRHPASGLPGAGNRDLPTN